MRTRQGWAEGTGGAWGGLGGLLDSMSNGVTFCDREVVEDHNHRPRGFQIAHINRMVICHLWGVREKRNSKRAQKIKLNKLSGSRLALCVNRVKKRLSEPLHARSRLGGGCLSIVSCPAPLGWTCHYRSDPLTCPMPRYPLLSVPCCRWCVQFENASGGMHVCARWLAGVWHCEAVLTPLVVGQLLIPDLTRST